MKRSIAAVAALLVLLSCATLRPGEDPILVRAQQTYETAVNTFNALFVIEDENEAALEARLPGTHAKVEKLRRLAREHLPRLLRAIDAYDATAGGSDLAKALAMIEWALGEAQSILAQTEGGS